VEVFAIPVGDKFLLYRPLRRLAFIGNQAMVDLTMALVNGETPGNGTPAEAAAFLEAIGFLEPDPPPPQPPVLAYQPVTAVLLLTSRCNLRCTYCYADGGQRAVQDLSLSLARTAIDLVCRNAIAQGYPYFELIFHGGGEPVQAWKTVQQAVAYARGKELPCHISMVTNGVCSAQQRQWLVHNLDNLSLSLDGRPQTQDRQRPFASGRGSFQAVKRTLKTLDEAGFSYGIRMTATAPWRGQLPEDVRFICQETGCRAIQVEPAFNARRGVHQGPAPEESEAFIEAFMEAFEIARSADRQLTYSGARPWLLTHTFCTAPYSALIVNPLGRLVACYEIADGVHPLADMSILGHVAGEQMVVDERARNTFLAYLDEQRAACRGCFCYWHCAGDCYTRRSAAAPGYPPGASPRCTMNREITARILLWYIANRDGVWQGQGAHPQMMQIMRTF
jgi:uncharacterized protein